MAASVKLQYYKRVGGASNSYRNPHFPAVRICLWTWLNLWWKHEIAAATDEPRMPLNLHVFDLAAGSGEATIAVQEWWRAGLVTPVMASSDGVEPMTNSTAPSTLQQPRVPFIPPALQRSRLTSDALLGKDDSLHFSACDPYTSDAYVARTGLLCESLSFKDVSLGQFPSSIRPPSPSAEAGETSQEPTLPYYDMIICSFALHLLESSSEVWALLTALSPRAKWLIILEPHKKPEIKSGWGWEQWDAENWTSAERSSTKEILRERVHCRIYRSTSDVDGGLGE